MAYFCTLHYAIVSVPVLTTQYERLTMGKSCAPTTACERYAAFAFVGNTYYITVWLHNQKTNADHNFHATAGKELELLNQFAGHITQSAALFYKKERTTLSTRRKTNPETRVIYFSILHQCQTVFTTDPI